jgi:hypothetical protein
MMRSSTSGQWRAQGLNNGGLTVIDGTYGFVYCGTNGLGLGVFKIEGSTFAGADTGGVLYEGKAQEGDDGSIYLDLNLAVPSGTPMARGAASQEVPHTRRIQTTLPPAFGDGAPQEVDAQPGSITVMIKRIRDDFLTPGTNPTLSDTHRLGAASDAYFKGRSA